MSFWAVKKTHILPYVALYGAALGHVPRRTEAIPAPFQ